VLGGFSLEGLNDSVFGMKGASPWPMPLVSDFIRFENNGGLDADGVTVGGLMFDDAKG
jgi:hypothetical protein